MTQQYDAQCVEEWGRNEVNGVVVSLAYPLC